MNEKAPQGNPDDFEEKPTDELLKEESAAETQDLPALPDAPDEETPTQQPGEIPSSLRVKNSSGDFEEDWEFGRWERDKDEEGKPIEDPNVVLRKLVSSEKGKQWIKKTVKLSELNSWNPPPEQKDDVSEPLEEPEKDAEVVDSLQAQEANPETSDEEKDQEESSAAKATDDKKDENSKDKDPKSLLQDMNTFNLEEFEDEYYEKHGRHFEPVAAAQVYYVPDEKGHSQLGLEYGEGSVVNWKEALRWQNNTRAAQGLKPFSERDLAVVIRASAGSKHYTAYIKGGKIYEIVRGGGHREMADGESHDIRDEASSGGEEPSVRVSEIGEDKLPNLMVGQKFGEFTLDKVEVGGEKFKLDKDQVKRTLQAVGQASPSERREKAHLEKQQFLKIVSKPRLGNPYNEAELAITRIKGGVNDAGALMDSSGRVIGGEAWMNAQGTEIVRQATGHEADYYDPEEVRDKIAEFGKLFIDRTFVPTIDQLKEMQDLARYIKVVDYNANRPVYRLSDGSRLPIRTTGLLVKNARNSRWLMSDFAEKNYTKVSRETPILKMATRKLFTQRPPASEKEYSIPLLRDFRQALEASGTIPANSESKAVDRQVDKLYRLHIQQRVVLSKKIKEFTKESVMRQRDIFTDSFAINAYTAMHGSGEIIIRHESHSRSRKKTLRGRAATKLNKGLDAVHRTNMRIDGAIRSGMDEAAIRASIAGRQAVRKVNRGMDKAHRGNMRIDGAVRSGMDKTAIAASQAKAKAGRKINSGLDKTHRGNMRVDGAVQRKMDVVAARASQAHAKAREVKDLWDGNHEELLSRRPTDITGAALRDYVAWERQQGRKPIRRNKR